MRPILDIPCNPANYGALRSVSQIRYIVFHYTGNDGDSDTANAWYYRDNALKSPASAHYFVDDDSIARSVPDRYVAWAVGGKKWADCPQTGGGRLYGVVTNANSISIELCDTVKDGKLMATEATLENAVELAKQLMEEYHIPVENVVRHFDVTGKHCPAYFIDEEKWAAFKERLARPKPWYEDVMDWGKERGICDGTRPNDACTRAEVLTMIMRAEQIRKP